MARKSYCLALQSLEYHPHIMLGQLISRITGRSGRADEFQDVSSSLAQRAGEALADGFDDAEGSAVLTTLGWVSAAMGALAVGLFVGRELRLRYKFHRRTPYDFYAHSGDKFEDMEFGLGI